MNPRIASHYTAASNGGLQAEKGLQMDDFEVLRAGRIYPDGDPAALIREQLQRIVKQAQSNGLVVFVEQRADGPFVQVVRKAERA